MQQNKILIVETVCHAMQRCDMEVDWRDRPTLTNLLGLAVM
jgi:hypothetical protein